MLSNDIIPTFNCVTNFVPRPHQLNAYNYAINNPERIFIVEAVMGSGKNKLIQMIAQYYYMRLNNKVMITTDLTSVVNQLKFEAQQFKMLQLPIYSCSKISRDVSILDEYDVLLIDECHTKFTKILEYITKTNLNIRVIGFTATATNPTLWSYYQSIQCFATYSTMYELGYLVNIRFFGVLQSHAVKTDDLKYTTTDNLDKESSEKLNERLSLISADLVNDYLAKENGKSGIILMPTIKISHEVCELFNRRSISCAIYTADSGTIEEKKKVLRNFITGNTKILISVNAVSKGFDAPIAEFLFDCRPRSVKMGFDGYAQSTGRILRIMAGKTEGRVYDYVGNYQLHSDNFFNYLEQGSAGVSFNFNAKRTIIVCEFCQFIISNHKATHCPNCNMEIVKIIEEPKKVARKEIKLISSPMEMVELIRPYKTKIEDMVAEPNSLLLAFLSTLKYTREVNKFGTDKPLAKLLWRAFYLTRDFVPELNTHIKAIEEMYKIAPLRLYTACLAHIKSKNKTYKESLNTQESFLTLNS